MRTRQAGESALLLLDAVDVLARVGIRYAVIGAMAAAVHGVVRALSDPFGNRVDLLFGLRGLHAEAFARAVPIPFQGGELRVASGEDCIAMKLFPDGPQDRLDAQHPRAAAAGSVDSRLLQEIASGYGPETVAAWDRLRAGS